MLVKQLNTIAESGWLPDCLVRVGIRTRLKKTLDLLLQEKSKDEYYKTFIHNMSTFPIAPFAQKANTQHYELPTEFFKLILGEHLKYSCGFWFDSTHSLTQAETQALRISCERAQLQDNQKILELGCGWGSLSLWMAKNYPNSSILAVSNSHKQRLYILKRAQEENLLNLKVMTCDMNTFNINNRFDRIISIEMFEHMRNWPDLFEKINNWLTPDGLFFMHVFCHKSMPYSFDTNDKNDWMSQHFFSEGMMPSAQLPLLISTDLHSIKTWTWNGEHYQKTANAWLKNMDNNKYTLFPILLDIYGKSADLWWQRWRIFFMSCAECFAYRKGEEWFVGHYLYKKSLLGK